VIGEGRGEWEKTEDAKVRARSSVQLAEKRRGKGGKW